MSQSLGINDYVSTAIEKHADMVCRIWFLYLRNSADVERSILGAMILWRTGI